jgi:hypothetical protein
MAMIQPKSQKFKTGHDGILSIGNFILMIKNHILLFSCPVPDQQPKNVLPISVATRNFLFILKNGHLTESFFFPKNNNLTERSFDRVFFSKNGHLTECFFSKNGHRVPKKFLRKGKTTLIHH